MKNNIVINLLSYVKTVSDSNAAQQFIHDIWLKYFYKKVHCIQISVMKYSLKYTVSKAKCINIAPKKVKNNKN